ncbi:isocitrate lyase/phosphoenolpyruvate mutase family protein [Fulvimonas yonginensis]|uniref:Isocitrate lyase/phosphoenolpyruvate mutase family protein n=1 Tax=Fulvimonas yonginensis TaxID=1495200 RepID=A0ABU8J812_9GAMM
MLHQAEMYERFAALHARHGAFIMPNAWDGISALILQREGFEALGTSSLAIAFAAGRQDGTGAVGRDEALANAVLLGRLSGLPVNGDLENGFGPAPDDCRATVEAAIAAGLAGLGIEDTTADPAAPLFGFDAAVARVAAAARAAKGRIVLTGRTDNYLQGKPDLDDTIRRLTAFAEAGADVLYAPGLPDLASIRAVVRAVAPKPVNVVVGPAREPCSLAELDQAGVKRVSLGGALYRCSMRALRDVARRISAGDLPAAANGLATAELGAWLGEAARRGRVSSRHRPSSG